MRGDKDNFLLKNTFEVHSYTGEGRPAKNRVVIRDRQAHGKKLLKQLDEAWKSNEQQKAMFASIKDRKGTYIEFKGAENYNLVYGSLENATQGIKLLNVRCENSSDNNGEIQTATVFVPSGKEGYFADKIHKYLNENTSSEKPKNKKLIESIETIQLAVISSFWIGEVCDIPSKNAGWCEFWLQAEAFDEQNVAKHFYDMCERLQIEHKKSFIVFPEKVILLAKTNCEQIQLILNTSKSVAEIRRAPEIVSFYTHMFGCEADAWMADVKDRLSIGDSNVYVCVLDTGVNNSHQLLNDVLDSSHMQSVEQIWGNDDRDGHGTQMAGLCEYYDLEPVLLGQETIRINHKLESVKLLPNSGTANDAEVYGDITSQAVSLSQIVNPQAQHVYCMAVTADKYILKDGAPSSWSARLDDIIVGEEDGIKKLFVVSAGNVLYDEIEKISYPDANLFHSVEDPGQSWNAITVGSYSNKIQVEDELFENWEPIADVGELCPFSSTSVMWDGRWPIKPEILMDGGNALSNGKEVDVCDDLSILTTNRDVIGRPFASINATSSATAQAAYMAAELMSAYPNLWEESIRALMIHSAQWTEKMKKQFCYNDKRGEGIHNLLRSCGYGIASLERARYSADNSVNMIIQAELQPYWKDGKDYKMKDMHLHKLPWPSDKLRELDNTMVSVKVTLSYFIEASPD